MTGYLETLTNYYKYFIAPAVAHADTVSPVSTRRPNCEDDHFIPAEQRAVLVLSLQSSPQYGGAPALRAPQGDAECRAKNTNAAIITPVAIHVQYIGLKTFNPAFTCVDEIEIFYTDCAFYISTLKTE